MPEAVGNGIDEVAVVGLGDVDFDRLAVLQHGDGSFRMEGDVQGPCQIVDGSQGDEAEVDGTVGLCQAVDGFIQRPVAAHGKYRIEAGQGCFLGPFRRVAGFLRFPQFDVVEHRFQLLS